MPERLLRRLRRRIEARRALDAALRASDGVEGARIGRSLLAKDARAVFSGRLGERDVVFKLVRHPERAERDTAAYRDELAANWPRMSAGALRVPEPIAFFPERGLSVTALAHGRRLTGELRRSHPTERARLTGLAADWLALYTAERRQESALTAGFWIRHRVERIPAIEAAEDRARAERLIEALRPLAGRLDRMGVTQVRPHGDFWGDNLLWDGTILTGIDLQHTTWHPLARDAARFLVHLALICPEPEGPWRHGLPEGQVRAVEERPLLQDEPEGLLRFFVAIELAHRLISEARFPAMLAGTRAATDRLIAELDRVDAGHAS